MSETKPKCTQSGRDPTVVTSQDIDGRWCPDVCPITLEPFFMWIEHPYFGWVPTYGGPFDSYTIPEPTLPEKGSKPRMDIEYHRYRYDHDEGGWLIDECEAVELHVVPESKLIELGAWQV